MRFLFVFDDPEPSSADLPPPGAPAPRETEPAEGGEIGVAPLLAPDFLGVRLRGRF